MSTKSSNQPQGHPVHIITACFHCFTLQCKKCQKTSRVIPSYLVLGESKEDLELLECEELPSPLRRLGHDGRQDALPEGAHPLRPVHLPHAVHDAAEGSLDAP